jgi:hypothetical protein
MQTTMATAGASESRETIDARFPVARRVPAVISISAGSVLYTLDAITTSPGVPPCAVSVGRAHGDARYHTRRQPALFVVTFRGR